MPVLAYLRHAEVEPLRLELLALAERARGGVVATAPASEPAEERVLTVLPTGRMIASLLISDVGICAELLLIALGITAVLSTKAAVGIISAGIVAIIALGSAVWSRFNGSYRLTVAESPDGLLHVRSGLVGLTAETIRPGRNPGGAHGPSRSSGAGSAGAALFFDLAGRQRKKRAKDARRSRPAPERCCRSEAVRSPRASRPPRPHDRPQELFAPAPRRAVVEEPAPHTRWLASGPQRKLRRRDERAPASGHPLGPCSTKVQSFRRIQGPVQRYVRLGLATIHLDTAGRNVHARRSATGTSARPIRRCQN